MPKTPFSSGRLSSQGVISDRCARWPLKGYSETNLAQSVKIEASLAASSMEMALSGIKKTDINPLDYHGPVRYFRSMNHRVAVFR